jgi:RNA polymerase sigma factor (sigma-70 family)
VNEADLVQEAWAFLLEANGQRLLAHEEERGVSLEQYVSVIVRRSTINHLQRCFAEKRGGAREMIGLASEEVEGCRSAGFEEAVLSADLLAALAAGVAASMPQRALEVLESVYFCDRSVTEAADAIGVSAQVVRNWQTRIRRFARSTLRVSENR